MTVEKDDSYSDGRLLDGALPAISRLGASLANEREASRSVVRSADLLDALTGLGNAIAEENGKLDSLELIAPRRWAAEEFHSGIISWLLNPSAHHRRAGHFIAALLNATIAPSRLLDGDWSGAQVIPEWENVVDGQRGYLDILVLDEYHQNLIAIENKTFSQEHSNQLTRYRRALAEAYPAFARHHIFLSPPGLPPLLERDREHWQPARYSVLHDAVRQVLATGIVDQDASALLQIYATTIRRNVMPDTSIDRQARRIYLEHWEALDRILANKVNWTEETKPMLREAVAKHSFWRLDCEGVSYVCFRAAEWDEFPGSRAGNGMGAESNALLLFSLLFDDELPYLALEMSPADPEHADIRAATFDAVKQNPSVFKQSSDYLTDDWVMLHMEPDYMLELDDYGPNWDDGTARGKIEAWLEDFAANKFPEMNRIIVDCLRGHQEG